ncbi:MAG: aspartyl protease family protein [Gemmataceae bacterium]|nr:aspartyl protease family protein [Gemmataceae bacterium]
MKMRLTLAACLFLGLVLPVRAEEPKPVTVPFELLKTKHMAIMVKINGKGPYRVIFDTGAPFTVISSKVAKEAGVLPKDAAQPVFALFGAMGQHPIQTLELGELKAEKVPAMVMDHPAVAALAKATVPLEGIVGFPFFARYRMTLDYQAKTLTFLPNTYEPEDILQSLTATLMARKKPTPKVLAPAALWGLTVAKDDKDEEEGVTVQTVLEGSPAAKAGLLAGDRLLTIDGRWTDSVMDCYTATGFVKPDRTVELAIRRKGVAKALRITPRAGL